MGPKKVKFIQVTNLARTLAHLKETTHVRVIGTMLDENALPIQKCDFSGAVVIVMGAEDTGLRPLLKHSVTKKPIFQCQVTYKA